jgi:hypothetical protein
MYIDDSGLFVADPGDGFNLVTMLRKHDRGALPSGAPMLGINHTYSILVREGRDDPKGDGTVGCASRYSSEKAPYGATAYNSRGSSTPGSPGSDLYVMTRACRENWSCEGMVKLPDPQFKDAHGKPFSNNGCSISIENAGSGWWRDDGTDWSGPAKAKRKVFDGVVINLNRPDFIKVGRFYWQVPTAPQVYTLQRFWAAACKRYPSFRPEHAIHGHEEMGSGNHMCPGPPLMAALARQVLPYLVGEQPQPVVEPEQMQGWADMFSEDAMFSVDPVDWFADMGGRASTDQVLKQFSQDEVETLYKAGYVTHDDEANQVCDPDVLIWVGPSATSAG